MVVWWQEGRTAYGNTMYSFVKQLQYVKYRIKWWNESCFENFFMDKIQAQSRVDGIN